MPSGVYIRTEKHSFNKGRKHPNRKSYRRGWTDILKVCLFCNVDFITNCKMPNKKFCSMSCRSKNNKEISIEHLKNVNREYQKSVASSIKGELHPRWIKDRELVKKSEKKHLDTRYKQWMLSVKTKDNWKCKIENLECEGKLEAHHILNWKEYPEERFNLNNGITLCHFHHPKGRSAEKKFKDNLEQIIT